MADKIKFSMIMHNHQPVGNFGWVFQDAADDSYVPFLDALERHPILKTAIHTTGPLLEWFEENMPEYLDRLALLVKEGRMEIMGGAFYEPILTKLPDRDKRGQINMMNDWIAERFGAKPEGCWVAERIWEPYFAGIYSSCGLKYTTLDNTHFQYAGMQDKDIWGSYSTEDQGQSIRVLPIDYQLRYLIPFHEPQETIDYIGSLKDRGVTAVTYADDGEKFGVWPGTKKWVFEDGWLERFFTALEDNSDWIDITLPGDYVRETPPLGRVYLPTASYKEMSEWALPVEAQKTLTQAELSIEGDERMEPLKPFIRGGFWRNFLSKYPESHNMYRRMLTVSDAVDAASKRPVHKEAARELYKAQCNCGYWHGVFGGLYLNFLRRAIYEHLIKAESLVRKMKIEALLMDFDGDGYDEAVLSNDALKIIVAPQQGGAALELDYYPKAFNMFDTMTRREELYHSLIPEADAAKGEDEHASIHDGVRSKEADIRKYLHYDPYRRLNFIDHFIQDGESLEAFANGEYHEAGDFVNAAYDVVKIESKSAPGVHLLRKGHVRSGDESIPVTIYKDIALKKKGAAVELKYVLEFDGEIGDILFGPEMNLGLQSGYADDSFIEIPGRKLKDRQLASTGIEPDVNEVSFTVGWMPLKITLKFSKKAELRRFPIETVSQSEGGVERTYQNTCLVPVWKPVCDTEGRFEVTLTMEVETW